MKIIKILSEKIEEELKDAIDYIRLAIEYKDEYPNLANTFYTLSLQETEHMSALHTQVAEVIQQFREKNGEPPVDMMAVYNFLHKQQIEKTMEAKVLQGMFKEA